MALDLNTGYSNVFKTFVDFAQKRVDANDDKAIADAHANPLGDRKVLDKIEELCGPLHRKQANAVMFAVSQSGTMQLKAGLKAYGLQSSEHAAVNFTLSRNADTGAVTVRYSSPESLPLRFSWTATIDTDGNMTATPLVVEKPAGGNAKA